MSTIFVWSKIEQHLVSYLFFYGFNFKNDDMIYYKNKKRLINFFILCLYFLNYF